MVGVNSSQSQLTRALKPEIVMYQGTIESINRLQEARLRSITRHNDRLKLIDGPATKIDGLYWIYTTHSDADLLAAAPSPKASAVNFGAMVNRHAFLSHVCRHSVGGYRLVYNGIGGLGPKGHGGLRERILSEFRGAKGTGSLAITDSSLDKLDNWRYSYVLWSEIELPQPQTYRGFAETLELLWRVHYGWPVLCAK